MFKAAFAIALFGAAYCVAIPSAAVADTITTSFQTRDSVRATVMTTGVLTGPDGTGFGANLLEGDSEHKYIYQIFIATTNARVPSGLIYYKDVVAFALDQSGESVPLVPWHPKERIFLASGNSVGFTAVGTYVANTRIQFIPEKIKVTWAGNTQTVSFKAVK
jgi:hypothetical protein